MNEFLCCDNENCIRNIESIMEDVNDLVKSEAFENANIGSSDNKIESAQFKE